MQQVRRRRPSGTSSRASPTFDSLKERSLSEHLNLLAHPWACRIAVVLRLHFLWQGALVAGSPAFFVEGRPPRLRTIAVRGAVLRRPAGDGRLACGDVDADQ